MDVVIKFANAVFKPLIDMGAPTNYVGCLDHYCFTIQS